MLEYVPIKELQRFLLKNGVVWDGKVFRETDGKYKKDEMKTSDYGTKYRGGLSIIAKVSSCVDDSLVMMVNETQLLLYKRSNNVFGDLEICLDLSEEWQNHLIDNYIWQYGPIIREYATSRIQKTEETANSKIESLNKKIATIQEKIAKVDSDKKLEMAKWTKILEKTRTRYSGM